MLARSLKTRSMTEPSGLLFYLCHEACRIFVPWLAIEFGATGVKSVKFSPVDCQGIPIILISHFQNKTGLSGNTSMFQMTVLVTTLVTFKHARSPQTPTSRGLWSFPQQNGAQHDSALSLPTSERGAGARLQPAQDHSEHTAATGPGTFSVSSPVCFHWESSGDTSPGFPNTEGWSVPLSL